MTEEITLTSCPELQAVAMQYRNSGWNVTGECPEVRCQAPFELNGEYWIAVLRCP